MPRHKKKRVSEVVARPARTAVQGTPAYLLVWLVDENFWNMNDQTFGVAVLLVTAFFSFVQTTVENAAGRGFLRQPPVREPAEVVADDAPPAA